MSTALRSVEVTLALWKWEGLVLAGGTPDQFKAFALAYIGADLNVGANSVGHAYVKYGEPFLIWILSVKDVATLAHEALHATAGILEARGLAYTEASEEAYTYTMESIMRQVLTTKRWKRTRT